HDNSAANHKSRLAKRVAAARAHLL
ncbi:MAG: hypothetical protein QOG36_1182, partial [Actinomycetota bacterium]|nr:hypothetical protein [Actinomycetota bacterium]